MVPSPYKKSKWLAEYLKDALGFFSDDNGARCSTSFLMIFVLVVRFFRISMFQSFSCVFLGAASFHHLSEKVSNPICFPDVTPETPNSWIVKVIVSQFVRAGRRSSPEAWVRFPCESRNPELAFHLIKSMNDPVSTLEFFEFTDAELGFHHSLHAYDLFTRKFSSSGLCKSAMRFFHSMRRKVHLVRNFSCFVRSGVLDAAIGLVAEARKCKCRVGVVAVNLLLSLLIQADEFSLVSMAGRAELKPIKKLSRILQT